MKFLYIAIAAWALAAVRIAMYVRRRRSRAATASAAGSSPAGTNPGGAGYLGRWKPAWASSDRLGVVGEIAMREIRERLRGRIFRVGTLIILIIVALAIILPKLTSSSSGGGPTRQTVGVLGGLSPEEKQVVAAAIAPHQGQGHVLA